MAATTFGAAVVVFEVTMSLSLPATCHDVHPLLPDVRLPTDWAGMSRIDGLDDELTITAWHGMPVQALDVQAEGPPMLCIAVFLDGEADMSIDGGPPLHATPGMAVIQTGEQCVRGRFRMPGGQRVRLIDIRYTPTGLLRAGGRPLVALQGDFLQDCSAAGSLMAGFRAPSSLLHLAADVVDCPYAEPHTRRLYLRAKGLEALAVVLDMVNRSGSLPADPRERQLLARARRLIEERYDEDWSVRRLAQTVGLSEKRLKAGFRSVAGRSVHAYLLQVRLDAAAALLAGGHSVTETALAIGFSRLSHFSKMFRQAKGVAPSSWAQTS
ncbi:helix-turn-helix transcriptional regulator [Bordetella holmesii]|nr:AraC family transcriptional regulator [Bordetella holmesii]AIT27704.1 bacterial regulatory helix-turn-helix s, AraC family protein [Bordetella holmesii 44057]EWM41772.1 bacterial regulatory helix-turn-helix s, AraC family protein [Bordetella holmesii 41130]EWM49281.1 bacterial regulatory helix-turn-helix s, AraC family protein [Bordetella holmesii 70147]KAK81163.1 DNA-binding helix-turn-helix protein [Bordetella holmesii CDC-H809-BH]KAK90671.1 DNA-binding helix-turn-helix protein [Bordetell